jgi:hypothetical protein
MTVMRFAAALWVALGALACDGTQRCADSTDCPGAEQCSAGACVAAVPVQQEPPAPPIGEPCDSDDLCGGAGACVDGACVAVPPGTDTEEPPPAEDPCGAQDAASGRCAPGAEPAGEPVEEQLPCTEALRAEGRCTGEDAEASPPEAPTCESPDEDGRCPTP